MAKKQKLSEIETFNWLKTQVWSTELDWNHGTIGVNVHYSGKPTSDKVMNFIKEQGFVGGGIKTTAGVKNEYFMKSFRTMTESEKMIS